MSLYIDTSNIANTLMQSDPEKVPEVDLSHNDMRINPAYC